MKPVGPTVIHELERRFREHPEAPAITLLHPGGGRERMSVADLRREAVAWGHALERAGIGQGDLALLVLRHSRALPAALWGALYRRAMPSVFPFLSERTAPEVYVRRVRHLVQTAGVRTVVTDRDSRAGIEEALGDSPCRILTVDDLAGGPPDGGLPDWPLPDPDEIACLHHSSGTTGSQKAITLPHRSILASVRNYGEALRLVPEDVVVSWMPLYHDGGLIMGFMLPLLSDLHLVMMSPFHWVSAPQDLFRAVHEFRGTLTWMPNFGYNHCVRRVRDEDLQGVDLSSWRAITNAAEPVRLDSHRMFLERFAPFGFREGALASSYGMAECTALVTSSRMGEPATVDWVDRLALQAERRAVPAAPDSPGAVPIVGSGWPVRGAELRVVDDQGRDLPERGVGQILVRCESMFKGYYGRPDLTEKVMRDGWHLSGDVGYLAGGQVHVTGRLKDLIIVAGRNVHPEDLEDAANEVEGIKRGRCVAFGVTDPRVGTEVVVLICELAAPLDEAGRQRVAAEVRARVWKQEIALFDVLLVDDRWMIKTSSGKIPRSANREKYLATFAPPELRG